MKVLIDGKEVPCENDVKVIYEGMILDTQDDREICGQVHITLTDEGMITDTFEGDEPDAYTTASEDLEDLIARTK